MTKQKIILVNIIALFVYAAIYMVYRIIKTKEQNQLAALTRQTLPSFTFYTLDSIATSNNFITKNNPVCIFYFNADCEHCQYEAIQINKKIALFGNTQILMISFNTIAEIKQFAQQYHLDYPNLTFLQDPKYEFEKWFGKTNVPSVFIYNAQHQLVKEYHGETKIEAIIKYL